MSIQNAIEVDLQYVKESVWGVTPTSPQMAQQRRVSSSLSLQKDTFRSNEARTDRNISDFRHGVRRVAGDIQGELSLGAWDDFIEAALGGVWGAVLTKDQTDFTSMAANADASTFTIGSGSWITEGFRIGDVVRFADLSEAQNNGRNFLITALTETVATVTPAPVTMSADTAFTVTRPGKKCGIGATKHSFTIEQQFPSISQYQVFKGCRVNTLALSLPPTGMFEITCGFMGKDMDPLSGKALDASPTASPTNSILAALNGSLVVGDSAVAVVTGLDINVTNNLTGEPVVGSNTLPELFYGRAEVTGTMTAFFNNATLINAFVNETSTKIMALVEEPTGSPPGFMALAMTNVKFGGADLSIEGEGGVTISLPYTALLASGTGKEASALSIQRSNA